MYYKLRAKNWSSYNSALLDADLAGLDPDAFNLINYTFEVGTGAIEKVTRLISRHNLDILAEENYAPNELSSLYGRKNV